MTPTTNEQRLAALGLTLPDAPQPLGAYVPAVQTGNLLFLSGMLPIADHQPLALGHLGRELDVPAASRATRAAALNALAVARHHLGTLDRVRRVVRLGVSLATHGDVRNHAQVADAASELLRDVLGPDSIGARMVFGVASLPLGTPVELELILEIEP